MKVSNSIIMFATIYITFVLGIILYGLSIS